MNRAWGALCLSALMFACSGESPATTPDADRDRDAGGHDGGDRDAGGPDAGDPDAAIDYDNPSGSGESVSHLVTVEGGTFDFGAVTLDIPAGALDADTTITVTELVAPVDPTIEAFSPVYQFEPDGLVFAEPVVASFTIPADTTAEVAIYWSRPDGGYDELPTTVAAARASAEIAHFSYAWVAVAQCGNGILEYSFRGDFEQCDDGNTVTELCPYGVPESCTVCNALCTLFTMPARYCGNTVVDGPEETCDVGSAGVTDTCPYGTSSCTVCNSSCQLVAGLSNVCGDGRTDGPEVCDDGNTITETCPYGDRFCTGCTADCTAPVPVTFCGDHAVNGPEACDDGNVSPITCPYGVESCSGCVYCNIEPGTVTGFCGDGVRNGPEACDDGNTVTELCPYGSLSCTVCAADCTSTTGALTGYCGDGVVNGAEQCDDFNDMGNDACPYGPMSCVVCGTGCLETAGTRTFCGDGVINGPEQCDGSDLGARTCGTLGFLGGTLSCAADCTDDRSGCHTRPPPIAAGSNFTCALRADGTIGCWGQNDRHQCEPPAGTFVDLAAGRDTACALRADGTVACWGYAGLGSITDDAFTRITVGNDFACGLRADGTVRCWGTITTTTPTLSGLSTIAADGTSMYALTTDGRLVVWSATSTGTPGTTIYSGVDRTGRGYPAYLNPDGTVSAGLAAAPAGVQFTRVIGNPSRNCGITTTQDIVCWGSAAGTTITRPGPYVALTVGTNHACAVRPDATIECWNASDGSMVAYAADIVPSALHSAVAVSRAPGGTIASTCAVTLAGALECWGGGATFVLPTGTFTTVASSARTGGGGDFGCALRTDGTIACWGDNTYGQATPPSGAFTAIALGAVRAYGLRSDGTVACWGASCGTYPVPADTFTAITATDDNACGVTSAGAIRCWGAVTSVTSAPTDTGYVEIGLGVSHGCARRNDGTLTCWPATSAYGETTPPAGSYSQLAVGRSYNLAMRSDGVLVAWGLSAALRLSGAPSGPLTSLSAGYNHACGVSNDVVRCWGLDYVLAR